MSCATPFMASRTDATQASRIVDSKPCRGIGSLRVVAPDRPSTRGCGRTPLTPAKYSGRVARAAIDVPCLILGIHELVFARLPVLSVRRLRCSLDARKVFLYLLSAMDMRQPSYVMYWSLNG